MKRIHRNLAKQIKNKFPQDQFDHSEIFDLLRLWILRLLVPLGGHREFISKHSFDNDTLAEQVWTYSVKLTSLNTLDDIRQKIIEPSIKLMQGKSHEGAGLLKFEGIVRYAHAGGGNFRILMNADNSAEGVSAMSAEPSGTPIRL